MAFFPLRWRVLSIGALFWVSAGSGAATFLCVAANANTQPAMVLAKDASANASAVGPYGAALLQMRHYAEAERWLQRAYDASPVGTERARWALHLGSLAALRQQPETAQHYYQTALAMAGEQLPLWVAAQLALARLAPVAEQAIRLGQVSQRLMQAPDSPELARYHLELGQQARSHGVATVALAYQHLHRAATVAENAHQPRLHSQAVDALAQLYEDQGRTTEALQLTRQALALAQRLPAQDQADVWISAEWRQGRLQQARGATSAALAAYQRAVERLEAERSDIPLDTHDGQSSFRLLIEPLYLGYIDLLLQQNAAPSEAQAPSEAPLRRAIEAVEHLRQAELQDFLGDRCAVETVQGGTQPQWPTGTAVLYPIILPDRLELLLHTGNTVVRQRVAVRADVLRTHARQWAETLRQGEENYLPSAQQLYDWLLRPMASALAQGEIGHLVVVPDSTLRLVPMAALHDGHQYAIEQRALSLVTSMALTHLAPPQSSAAALVTGVALPGPAVAKMTGAWQDSATESTGQTQRSAPHRGLAHTTVTRTLPATTLGTTVPSSSHTDPSAPPEAAKFAALEQLRTRLALPGVRDEIEALHQLLPGTALLDARFTVGQFQQEASSGRYRIVHIASHGLFGDSAASSFIMAYDDLLYLNQFQTLLASEALQRQPIELLGLSACETAQGNERAPLGIAGVAIKARAQSVLGTLWPIADLAATALMQQFYADLATGKHSKAQALRQAQLHLLHSPEMAHPFFWAPFVLIGNWQ